MALPRKWHEVYPQGTPAGNDEQKFFIALTRDPNFSWRSVAAISAKTGLSKKRVEQIINKYNQMDPPMVLQNPKNEDQWGYWELHKKLVGQKDPSVSKRDTDQRVDKALGKAPKKSGTKKSSQGGSGKSKNISVPNTPANTP